MLFISDAHLGGFSEEENGRIEAELVQLINYCQRKEIALTILGDLFDYWMEYPETVPRLGKKLLNRFESYNQAMGPTLFITGNHDNWTGEHLPDRGFKVEGEHQILSFGEHNVMVLHGDGIADHQLSLPRPPLHRLLRSDAFIKIYQKIFPPKTGIQIMKYFSRFSRLLEWKEDNEREQKLNQWAEKTIRRKDVDIIICGHDHIPRKEHFDFGTYINLGTFYRHRTMAYYNNGSVSLVCWHPELQTLKPFNKIDE